MAYYYDDNAHLQKVTATFWWLLKKLYLAIPYLPYLFAAGLIHTVPHRDKDNLPWNAVIIFALAALIYLAEQALIKGFLKIKATGTFTSQTGYWIFSAILLILHIWCVQAGLAMLLHKYNDGHDLSIVGAILFTIPATIRWVRKQQRFSIQKT